MGSLLIVLIGVQIITGLLVTFYFENGRFLSNLEISLEVWKGEVVQLTHANLPSVVFLFLFLHIYKGLLFGSFYKIKLLWLRGIRILLLTMGISFLGYVLPWGQISLWGATVITNLLRVFPFGENLVLWVWGGYFVSINTLKVFFSLHFILPLVLTVVILGHIITLHFKGSSNSLGVDNNFIKVEFNPIYFYKDFINLLIILTILRLVLIFSFTMLDSDNFIKANLIVSPIHIKPEWYFLQFYAILRAIPSKTGGVIFFFIAIILILLLRFCKFYINIRQLKIWKIFSCIFIGLNIMLIWLGGCPVETPYLELSQVFRFLYFIWFLLLMRLTYL